MGTTLSFHTLTGGQIEYPVKYGYDPDPESEEDRYLHNPYDD